MLDSGVWALGFGLCLRVFWIFDFCGFGVESVDSGAGLRVSVWWFSGGCADA